jgi:hypothetical protein
VFVDFDIGQQYKERMIDSIIRYTFTVLEMLKEKEKDDIIHTTTKTKTT